MDVKKNISFSKLINEYFFNTIAYKINFFLKALRILNKYHEVDRYQNAIHFQLGDLDVDAKSFKSTESIVSFLM